MAKSQTVKNMFSPRTKVVSPKGKQKAQQQFKEDADLNIIMRKFQKGEAIDHFAKYGGVYGDFNPHTYQESLNIIKKADEMFAELPSNVRNRFENDPSAFLTFVQNPDNLEEAKTMGLGLAPAKPDPHAPPQDPAPQAPAPAAPPPDTPSE